RSAADDRVELGAHDEMRQSVARGISNASALEGDAELRACQVLAAGQRLRDRVVAPPNDRWRELVDASVVRHRLVDARRGEREHPPNVGWRDEVPRRPEDVRSQNVSGRKLAFDAFV